MCVYVLFMIHTYEMFTDLMLLRCDDCGVILRIWLVVAMTENVSGTRNLSLKNYRLSISIYICMYIYIHPNIHYIYTV